MASDLPDRLAAFVAEHGILAPGERVVVGVSGGVDSIVLAYFLRRDYSPIVVHVHHGHRPDADQEADFVGSVCQEWEVPFVLTRISVPSSGNRQALSRKVRYEALEAAAREQGARVVAVAHHRDDVAETLLLQLFRGAGPRGWAAMPVSRPVRRGSEVRLIRPLRFARRREIESYAREQGVTWVEDPSNRDPQYRRGVLRTEIVPLLVEHFGDGVLERIAAAAELAESLMETGAPLSPESLMEYVVEEGGRLRLDALARLPEPTRLGLYLEMLSVTDPEAPRSTAAAHAIDVLRDAQPGRRAELGPVVVWRERDALLFGFADKSVQFIGTVSVPGRLRAPHGMLEIEMVDGFDVRVSDDRAEEIVDAAVLPTRLTLRTWRPGDRMRPLGLGGSKLVSDLLTDAEVPPSQRQRALVLADGDRPLWLVGHRLDESLAIGAATKRYARLRWKADADGG